MNSKIKFSFLLILFFSYSISVFAQTATIKGKLLGADRKPSADAIVGISTENSGLIKDVVKCDPEGIYSITITQPGSAKLVFCMPNHNPLYMPIYNKKDRSFTVDVQLAYYKYFDAFNEMSICNDVTGLGIPNAVPMKKEDDGTFSFEVKTSQKELRYQVYGPATRRSINGTESERFEPDYYGDYNSIISVKDGVAKVVFDPSKVLKSDSEQKVVISGSPFDEKFFELTNKNNANTNKFSSEMKKWNDEKKNLQYFVFDSGNFITELMTQIESEKDTELKKYEELIYISLLNYRTLGYDKEKASQWFTSIALSDPAWDMYPEAFFTYRSFIPQINWKDFEDNALTESKNNTIKLNILLDKLSQARYSNNTEEMKKVHELITTKYADLPGIQDYLKKFPIESAVQIGKEIPDFEVTSLDNPEEKISKKSMLGKIYMIDFWATWCSPCVGEMDAIHKAYEKYKGKGFEIVSLSLDNQAAAIEKFRKEKYPMPWKNAFINDTEGKKIADRFEVMGIPSPFLISSTGVVLATSADLRSDKLDETLAKYFGGE